MPALLIITAVAAERDAIAGGAGFSADGSVGPYELWAAPGVTLVEAGVGPAAAAAATAAPARDRVRGVRAGRERGDRRRVRGPGRDR